MLNFLGFGNNVDLRIVLHDEESRKCEEFKQDDGDLSQFPIFYDGETVCGQVLLGLKRGGKLEHQGIRIELVGCIEFRSDRARREDFISLVKDLARPGILSQPTSYPFEFTDVSMPYETYRGAYVRLRYFLRVTVQRRLTDLTNEREFSVHTLAYSSDPDERIQMEVGIEDSLHIEFNYDKSRYHLRDVIVGRIYFSLVRVKIKNMEIQLLKRETIGYGPNSFSESETVAKYEIMDGAPVRGESIPLRLFLQSYPLTPTMRDVKKRFSVRYFINLVLLDEEDRRYYKQQEIVLYRRSTKHPRPPLTPTKQTEEEPLPLNGDSLAEPSHDADIFAHPPTNVDDSSERPNDVPESNTNTVAFPTETQPFKPNGMKKDGHESSASCSPEAARASRSMTRYEPKQHDSESLISDRTTSPARLEIGSPPRQTPQHFFQSDPPSSVPVDAPECDS